MKSLTLVFALHFLSVPVFASAVSYTIEDGEEHDSNTNYDEKPALLELSSDRSTQGSKSLHFKTTDGVDGHSLITKFRWPEAQDFSLYAKSGAVAFDIWVRNPQDMRSANMGALIEFTLMSRGGDGDKATTWCIGSSLFKAEAWNHVELAIQNGVATLRGSTVNDVPLASDKGSSVTNHGMDWSRVNYHRFAIPHHGPVVEGYIDQIVIHATN